MLEVLSVMGNSDLSVLRNSWGEVIEASTGGGWQKRTME